jgi:hypothetical protein
MRMSEMGSMAFLLDDDPAAGAPGMVVVTPNV